MLRQWLVPPNTEGQMTDQLAPAKRACITPPVCMDENHPELQEVNTKKRKVEKESPEKDTNEPEPTVDVHGKSCDSYYE